MKKQGLVVLCMLAAALMPRAADAQPPAQNAALRYWMAFAYMQNPPADQDTSELLELVASGKAAWDEGRLGKILDANAEALGIMQRGTKIDTCDWGLEYDLGSNAPIAYIARARALGRLNILEGMRLAASGHANEAIEIWLTGVKFSQHVAENGTLLSALVSQALMLQNLTAVAQWGRNPSVDNVHLGLVRQVVGALPAAGLDWDGAWQREEALVRAERQKNPGVPHEMAERNTTARAREQELTLAKERALSAVRRLGGL